MICWREKEDCMSEAEYHLAQINIATLRYPLDHLEMASFVARLEEVNALADTAPGFVWRLQDESGDATAINAYADDNILINMSVWQSIDAWFDFSYRSAHAELLRDRKQWFEAPREAFLALWWVDAGHIPGAGEGVARLEHLRQHGPSDHAFTIKQRFSPTQSRNNPQS